MDDFLGKGFVPVEGLPDGDEGIYTYESAGFRLFDRRFYESPELKVPDEVENVECFPMPSLSRLEAMELSEDIMEEIATLAIDTIKSPMSGHPEFDNIDVGNVDSLCDLWAGISETYPQYKYVYQYWNTKAEEDKRKTEEIENNVILENDDPETLALAGLVSKEEVSKMKKGRPDLQVLKMLRKSRVFPESMLLQFSHGRLCVNGVPTVVREEDVMDLYNGMSALSNKRRALTIVVRLITKKLKVLFRKE